MPVQQHVQYFIYAGALLLSTNGLHAQSRLTWTVGAPAIEREAGEQELAAYPRDGQTVRVNPPGFTWTPNEKAKVYRLEVRRATERSRCVVYEGPLQSTVCALGRAFQPGVYVWQVVYLDGSGKTVGRTNARRFTVPKGLQPLVMPDVSRLKEQLLHVRPRLFLAGNRLAEFRKAVVSGNAIQWKSFLEAANASLTEEPYPEPQGYSSAAFNVDEWRRIYTPAKVGSSHLARLALAYQVTGDAKYLGAARRWMLAIASWAPRGITSHRLPQPNGSEGNDEASMPILDRMSLAWDWIGDRLTSSERAKVIAAMTERGNQVLDLLKRIDFQTHPFSNHEGRVLAFLGNAGLSFLGDIPEAEKWLDYVLRCYLTSYPGWGGDEGGWAQGLSYWGAYVNYHTGFAEALRDVTNVDLFRRPFYHSTGYFALYCLPPYAQRGAFGDGSERGPGAGHRVILERLADIFRDPVLRWAAESIRERQASAQRLPEFGIESVGAVLRTGTDAVAAALPAKLDGSRFFTDIGWVAMHSALGEEKEDVWALFKSSRFGSFSHSHADQNTFQLNAYGRALLIDSGYYPWYGSPHDQLWTRQTKAHNGILVNGRGQPPFEWKANGTIEEYVRRGLVTIARGQAAKAYNIPQHASVLKQWSEWSKEPIPPMAPEVETFERTVAFVGSRKNPVFFIHDHVRTASPTTFDWLAHALSAMKFEGHADWVRVENGDARLLVRLVGTQPFRFIQRNWFPVPPELNEATARTATDTERQQRYPNQWHLTAQTTVSAPEIKFFAVMVPYRATDPEPAVTIQRSGDIVLVKIAGTEAVAWMGAGSEGKLPLPNLSAQGRLAVRVVEAAKTETVVAQ